MFNVYAHSGDQTLGMNISLEGRSLELPSMDMGMSPALPEESDEESSTRSERPCLTAGAEGALPSPEKAAGNPMSRNPWKSPLPSMENLANGPPSPVVEEGTDDNEDDDDEEGTPPNISGSRSPMLVNFEGADEGAGFGR